jgi:hypothetical protein
MEKKRQVSYEKQLMNVKKCDIWRKYESCSFIIALLVISAIENGEEKYTFFLLLCYHPKRPSIQPTDSRKSTAPQQAFIWFPIIILKSVR